MFSLWKENWHTVKDERGVPTTQIEKKSIILDRCTVGLLSIGLLSAIIDPSVNRNPRSLIIPLILLLSFLLSFYSIWWRYGLRKRLKQLVSADRVCVQIGIGETDFQKTMEARGIKPRYNVNGQDYYDPEELGDVATLLRASQQPNITPETLLRPAAKADTPQEQLLRVVSGE
jgi:hypothetical protein